MPAKLALAPRAPDAPEKASTAPDGAPAALANLGMAVRARLAAVEDDGTLRVLLPHGQTCGCDCLQTAAVLELRVGDELLLMPALGAHSRGVVVGRIGPYTPPGVQEHHVLETTKSLTLKCGQSSIDLRADGKVLIRGDDVLVRAKGSKRIRAGSVSIN